jgi:hypothetical protein
VCGVNVSTLDTATTTFVISGPDSIICVHCFDRHKAVEFFQKTNCETNGSLVSSGSIVSDYGLDDKAIGVRSPAGAEGFSSSLCVQTGSGPTQPPVQWVPGVLSPGGKARPGRYADHSPHLVPRS